LSTAGQDLFAKVAGALWDLLAQCRSDAAVVLAALGPEPAVAGTALEGRLLAQFRPDAVASNDAAASALIGVLKSLLPNPDAVDAPVSLHGYDPGGGQPRGLALVFVSPPPAATLVVGLTGDGPGGVALELAAVGAGAFGPATLGLTAEWSVDLSGDVGAGGRLLWPRGGAPQVVGAGATASVTWTLRRAAGGQALVIGPDAGPHLALSDIAIGVKIGVDGAGAPAAAFTFASPRAQLDLAIDILSALVGGALSLPVDLDLGADPVNGLSLAGGGVRATLPANVSLPGVNLRAVELSLSAPASGLEFGFGVGLSGDFPGLPLNFTVDGVGVAFPFALGGGRFGVDPGNVRPISPTGFGLDITVPPISGGGFVGATGPGAYGGVLGFELIAIDLEAFGLLQLPVEGRSLSFVALLSVQFPPPGIQLSFGFSLNGVGGVIALNRRLDAPALQSAILDGSANQLLFPVDPASHALTVIATLGRVFPAADGHLVVGPMLQIGWGGRIITLSLAVVIDLPSPVQFVIIGRLEVALPDPEVPLVLLVATLMGEFEVSPTPQTSLTASLEGSNIAGIQLHGGLFFLMRGGDDPLFVLSVGGFHPRYARPQGVPALQRVQLALLPPGFPGLRSETYFAITSNSVQFGAHLQLCDEIAGCGVDGWFDFDALFVWDPTFAFVVHVSAGVAVQVIGETLMGVNFDLVLEGPAPWHIHGSGSVDLFLFSASLDFDVKWGSAPQALPPPPDLGVVFAAALADPNAWTAAPPANSDGAVVTLSAKASAALGGGHVVHPLGQLAVRQRAAPLGIEVSRYQNQPIAPQTWVMASAGLTADAPAVLHDPTLDAFPAGAFLNLSEDQKLSRPAFENFTSGAALTPVGVASGELRKVNTDFEVVLVPDITLGTLVPLNVLLALESLLAVGDPHLQEALWTAPGTQGVVVATAQPMGVATTDTFAAVAVASASDGFTATLQAAQNQFGAVGPAASVQVVEQWELAA
jgi:hypothetical protein